MKLIAKQLHPVETPTVTTTDTEVCIAVNGQFVTLPIRNAVAMSNEILDQVRQMLPPAIPR
jgi:hypothetical protein